MNQDQNMIFYALECVSICRSSSPGKKFTSLIFSVYIYIHTPYICICDLLICDLHVKPSYDKAKKTTISAASDMKHCCKKYYNE